jgi:RNA polymerase sigma factor (sigma-70 family)
MAMKVFIQSARHEQFEAIYKQRYRRVWGYFRSKRVSDAESHDLTQDTFTRFWEYLDDLRDADKENQMLDAIAHTVLLNHIRYWKAGRRAKSSTVEIDALENFDPSPTDAPNYEADIDRKRQMALLFETMKQLPRAQYDAEMLLLQGLTYEEIATALRTTVESVRTRLREARRFLRERLNDIEIPEERP